MWGTEMNPLSGEIDGEPFSAAARAIHHSGRRSLASQPRVSRRFSSVNVPP
jgi:hypothetical protein